jgi:hypothetical protein
MGQGARNKKAISGKILLNNFFVIADLPFFIYFQSREASSQSSHTAGQSSHKKVTKIPCRKIKEPPQNGRLFVIRLVFSFYSADLGKL